MPRKKTPAEKDDAVRKSQRIFLSCLTEEPSLLAKAEKYISPEDFTDPLYREIAEQLFEGIRAGALNAARILSRYADDEEKEKRAAAVFNASAAAELEDAERYKAVEDCIRRIRMEHLDQESRAASDMASLQRILREKTELKTMKIDLGGA